MERLLNNIEQITLSVLRQNHPDYSNNGNDQFLLFNSFSELPFNSNPQQLNGITLLLCQEGKVKMRLSDKEYGFGKDDIVVLTSTHVISDFLTSRDCKGIAIYGTLDFFQEIAKSCPELSTLFVFLRNTPVVHVSNQEASIFKDYFDAIQMRVRWQSHRFMTQVAATLLSAMILDMGHWVWTKQETHIGVSAKRSDKLFSDYIHLVEKNFREIRRVSWYAEQLRITPKYLSEVVKSVSQQTPNDWIDKYVVMEIRVLLRNTTMSIGEITTAMHFPNQSFLGKYFKEHVGVSPTKYRKNF